MTARADLREKTRHAWNRSPPAISVAGAPAPGDVVVLECTEQFKVEWVILACDSELPGRVLAVAADDLPLVGSADLAIPASAARGPLVLRCGFGGWLDAEVFAEATRTATLTEDEVADASDHWTAVESGSVVGSILVREVDDDPDYRDWVDEALQPAWQTIVGQNSTLGSEVAGIASHSDGSQADPATLRQAVGVRSLALAATVLLALGAGLFWRQHQELSELRGRHQITTEEQRDEIAKLCKASEQRDAKHRQELAAATRERERLEAESQRQLTELGQQLDDARRQTVVRNPVALSLAPPRNRRGDEKRVVLPADASHVLLFMTLEEGDSGQNYSAELFDRATDERLWVSTALRQELRELRIGLPRDLLPTGDYLLRILKPTGDGSELVAEYPLKILDRESRR